MAIPQRPSFKPQPRFILLGILMNTQKQQEKLLPQKDHQLYQGYQSGQQNQQGNFRFYYKPEQKHNHQEQNAREEQYDAGVYRADKY